ncbi:restriction endonuclease subunit S [Bacteroides acidifaciens]|uniref:restriction endonuclease subunit S n=1 Tax=Bacteroides acidifaciens TaxID=85831 RepID=UPI002622223D|nr:restriction endonuclease subunit S [Bacteroides acidifaciens]
MPTLRFPSFTEEWQKHSLDKLGTTIIGLTYSPSDVVKENGTIVFRSSNIQNGEIDYSDIVRVGKEIKPVLRTKESDILICARNGSSRLIGKNAILKKSDEGQTFGAFMMIYRSKYNKFIRQLLNTKRYSMQVAQNIGARINQITTSDLNNFIFNFPTNPHEQKKIADFLSLLDERIALQSKLIDRLKSLMDGIIDKVTARTPNVSIGECLDCYSSNLQECETEEQGTYPVYGANGVCGYLDYATISAPAILIVKDGSGVGNVSYTNGNCSVVGTLNYLQPKKDVSAKFLYFVLKRFNFQPYKTGMAIPHIYFKAYSKTRIFCPDYEEQTRMAASLSRIEDKIALEERLLCLQKEQKHYLLSAMFI